ncbi:energy transducer TonB [Solimonas marina]|uniref:Energy transducer TonB n=1 Tax=Solimonas marina TaxID=2714601 RepID=A0A969W9I0_9GAMM|nr:energy transducer TonB [Solimonas marina]NKF22468.1 energy transducer TonB [Solimonas marina]
MAAVIATAPHYLGRPRPAGAPQWLALALIVGLHTVALAALFAAHAAPPKPAQPPRTMMVSFVTEQPKPTPPAPPPPKRSEPPKPKPKMIATPKPSPSPIVAPPIDKPPPPDSAPKVEEVPPAPPQVVPPNFVAAYLNNPGPRYPHLSVQMREQGTVLLLVLVDANGRAQKVTVKTSSGHSRLDDAAVDVVRQRWRFVPAKQGDQNVAAWVEIPITFELKHRH